MFRRRRRLAKEDLHRLTPRSRPLGLPPPPTPGCGDIGRPAPSLDAQLMVKALEGIAVNLDYICSELIRIRENMR